MQQIQEMTGITDLSKVRLALKVLRSMDPTVVQTLGSMDPTALQNAAGGNPAIIPQLLGALQGGNPDSGALGALLNPGASSDRGLPRSGYGGGRR